jgi:hypothetical protein
MIDQPVASRHFLTFLASANIRDTGRLAADGAATPPVSSPATHRGQRAFVSSATCCFSTASSALCISIAAMRSRSSAISRSFCAA